MNLPKKILFIDDDIDEYDILFIALNECCKGVELIYEKNAKSALTRMANEEADAIPDIVFLDWHMPEISGKEVLIALRKLPHYTNIPIVIFSGTLNSVHLDESKELGANFFLEKPPHLTDLNQKLLYLFSLDWRNTKSPCKQI